MSRSLRCKFCGKIGMASANENRDRYGNLNPRAFVHHGEEVHYAPKYDEQYRLEIFRRILEDYNITGNMRQLTPDLLSYIQKALGVSQSVPYKSV